MNGILLSNIINYDSDALNIEMRELIKRAIRTICGDLDEFQLLILRAPRPVCTRVGHLRFDDPTKNGEAVQRLDGLPIWLGGLERPLNACLNPRPMPRHVAEINAQVVRARSASTGPTTRQSTTSLSATSPSSASTSASARSFSSSSSPTSTASAPANANSSSSASSATSSASTSAKANSSFSASSPTSSASTSANAYSSSLTASPPSTSTSTSPPSASTLTSTGSRATRRSAFDDLPPTKNTAKFNEKHAPSPAMQKLSMDDPDVRENRLRSKSAVVLGEQCWTSK